MHRTWLSKKKLAVIRLDEQDVEVAAVYGGGATKLNLDASMLCCDRSGYSSTRIAGTKILLKTAAAYGMRYRCRNHDTVTSLMLITRSGTPARLLLEDEMHSFSDPRGRKLLLATLHNEFSLQYAGTLPN